MFYDDKSVYDALAVNGKSVAVKGILAQAGKNGREGSYIVSEVLSVPLGQAEQVFDKKMSASASGVDDGYDWPDEMRRYYWQMLYGLEGYSNGAIEGIVSTYGESEDAYTATMGLAYVNCDYAASVVSSLRTMDDKYHFMTDEYWEKIDNLDIHGVGKLSEYQHVAGPHMQPVFPELDEVQPATPSVAASFDTATDAVDGYTATADVSLEEDSQLAMIRRRSAELATYFDESVVGAEADIEPSTV